jgi:polygalacturonase
MLKIAKGARLLGSTDLKDYPDKIPAHATIMDSHYKLTISLIYAENCERIGICGDGEINGRGAEKNFPGHESGGPMPGRPFLIRFIECKKVVMDGIHLVDSAAWMENYLACDDVIIQGIHVQNQANTNNDGIDIDGCHNVIVRDCFVNSEDDGMCFKGASERTMENVLVENCRFYSTCNALKFGTDSQGGFRNVLVRNVEVGGPSAEMPALTRRLANSGISWETVDGGVLENILCTNVHIVRAYSPIFLRLGDRGRLMPGQDKKTGAIRRIVFDGITGDDMGETGSMITGIPGAAIEDVVVRNVSLSVPGGGELQGPKPENVGTYPDAKMFGRQSPAYGFWVRHAHNIFLFNIAVTPQKPDARPLASAGPDVENVLLDGNPIPQAPPAAGKG